MKQLYFMLAATALLDPGLAFGGEYPFTKSHEIKQKTHRYVPQMILVDLDKDRDLDVVTRTSGHYGLISVWENKKKGKKWQERAMETKGFFSPSSMDVADIDGDKKPDIAAIAREGVFVIKNKKKGKKWKRRQISKEDNGHSLVRIGDVDGDGDADLIGAGKGIGWYENLDGKGKKWESPSAIYSDKRTIRKFEVADIDGDGDLDVIAMGAWYGVDKGIMVIVNEDGPWTMRPVRAEEPKQMEVFDYDDDGDIDIVATFRYTVEAFLNHENTGYFAHEPLNYPDKQFDLGATLLTDVDSDGDRDIVVGGRDGAIWWLENPGDHEDWEKHRIEERGWEVKTLLSVDFDKDGDQDFIAAKQGLGEWFHKEIWYENKARKGKKKKKKKKKKRSRR